MAMIDLSRLAAEHGYKLALDESSEIDPPRDSRPWYVRIPHRYGHIGVWGENTLSACTFGRIIKGMALAWGQTEFQVNLELGLTPHQC